MARSLYKIKYIDNSIYRLNKIIKEETKKRNKRKKATKPKFIYSRKSCIPSFLVDKFVWVYSGLTFTKIKIVQGMVGLKFGDLVYTKKRGPEIHEKKKKK